MSDRKNKKNAQRIVMPAAFPQAEPRFTVAVVGAGASGIAAACALGAHAQSSSSGIRIVLIEKGRKIGSSILRSGNGRCNFSHANIQPACFNRASFVQDAMSALEEAFADRGGYRPACFERDRALSLYAPAARTNAVLRWFFDLGLVWSETSYPEGLLYPFSNKATSVMEVLQAELERCGIERFCGVELVGISKEADHFTLRLRDAFDEARSASFAAQAVVFAAGGREGVDVLRASGLFGDDAFVPSRFVLGPLRTETRFLEGLDGIRARARLSCPSRAFSEEGEVLFRTYGISGIVVFNASRFVEVGDVIALDLAPDLSFSEMKEILNARARTAEARGGHAPSHEELLKGFFLPELARAIVRYSALAASESKSAPARSLQEDGIARLASAIKDLRLIVVGGGEDKQCQVCRGGLRVDALDPETMQAAQVPGLYITGEALDIDGPCGGYNLHWAWTSGLLAGCSLAQIAQGRLMEGDAADVRERGLP